MNSFVFVSIRRLESAIKYQRSFLGDGMEGTATAFPVLFYLVSQGVRLLPSVVLDIPKLFPAQFVLFEGVLQVCRCDGILVVFKCAVLRLGRIVRKEVNVCAVRGKSLHL